jgi:60 kDa SS-A/Ro ribonucleoprotein
MRDLLRTAHPRPPTRAHDAVFAWTCGKLTIDKAIYLPIMLRNYDTLMAMDASPVEKALAGIEFGLPREALPTEALADPTVWKALLPRTPPHALLRNLGVLTSNEVLKDNAMVLKVAEQLMNPVVLQRARVHPFAILLATMIYRQGHGALGHKTWTPIRDVLNILENAYDVAFTSVMPTGKRILIGVDVSGSMTAPCMGTPIPASTAAAAMAITLARTEPNATVVQFDTAVQRIVPITARTGIASIESHGGGGTNIASPIMWAHRGLRGQHHEFDAFIILTDNETWHGCGHPSEHLARYRASVNPNVKLVCCAMAANHANVVDPDDPLSFGSAGLDASLPSLIAEFINR